MSNYRIILCGVIAGRSIDEVAVALSGMSKKTPAALRPLLDGRRVVIKRTYEVNKAVRYKRALQKIGCVCVIEAEAPSSADAPASAITVNFTTSMGSGEQKQAAVREYDYPKKPNPGLREMMGLLRIKEWIVLGALLTALYYGYKIFVEKG